MKPSDIWRSIIREGLVEGIQMAQERYDLVDAFENASANGETRWEAVEGYVTDVNRDVAFEIMRMMEAALEAFDKRASTGTNERHHMSVLKASESDVDGIDPKRNAALEGAITELYEVIYTLEGLLDEEEDKYPDLPCSMRAAADGEPLGKDRLKIASAIFLLYRAQRVMQHLE